MNLLSIIENTYESLFKIIHGPPEFFFLRISFIDKPIDFFFSKNQSFSKPIISFDSVQVFLFIYFVFFN